MRFDRDLRRVTVTIMGALVTFFLVAGGIYYKMAHGAVHGILYGGPMTMRAAMGGLFGGGLAALVALILLLQLR